MAGDPEVFRGLGWIRRLVDSAEVDFNLFLKGIEFRYYDAKTLQVQFNETYSVQGPGPQRAKRARSCSASPAYALGLRHSAGQAFSVRWARLPPVYRRLPPA